MIALVVLVAALALPATASAAPVGADQVEARFAGIPQSGRILGSKRAPVTMTVFIDLKCPFCATFDREVMPKVIRNYVRRGKVRVIAEPQAFVGVQDGGADSRAAAAMAIALGAQRKFWNFVDLFYLNQQPEDQTYSTDPYLLELAAAIPGADGPRALTERSSTTVDEALARAKAKMERLNLIGVPSVFVGPTGKRAKYVVWHTRGNVVREIRRQLKRAGRKR